MIPIPPKKQPSFLLDIKQEFSIFAENPEIAKSRAERIISKMIKKQNRVFLEIDIKPIEYLRTNKLLNDPMRPVYHVTFKARYAFYD